MSFYAAVHPYACIAVSSQGSLYCSTYCLQSAHTQCEFSAVELAQTFDAMALKSPRLLSTAAGMVPPSPALSATGSAPPSPYFLGFGSGISLEFRNRSHSHSHSHPHSHKLRANVPAPPPFEL
eukprot:jgi/Hompol1/569/HPOL_002552-RA